LAPIERPDRPRRCATAAEIKMFDFDDGPQLRSVILDRFTGEVIGAD
jgi:hypothetical protein